MSVTTANIASKTVVDSLAQTKLDSLAHIREMQIADSMEMMRNIAREDSIIRVRETTRYIFGNGSQEVTTQSVDTISQPSGDTISQSSSYAVIALVLMFLYLVWLSHIVIRRTVRWSQFRDFNRETTRSSSGSRVREVVGQQQMLMRVLTWVLGLSMLSMLAVKLADVYIGIIPDVDGGLWVIGASIVVALCALYGWGAIKMAGYLSIKVEAMNELLAVKRRLFILSVLFISPVILMLAMSNFEQTQGVVYLLEFEVVVLALVFMWYTFLLFIRQNFSILHWILYLCAVELMPLSLVWGILRHLNL